MVFQATILHCKAILGWGQPGLMDEFCFDLLSSSPPCYHCATDTPILKLVIQLPGTAFWVKITVSHDKHSGYQQDAEDTTQITYNHRNTENPAIQQLRCARNIFISMLRRPCSVIWLSRPLCMLMYLLMSRRASGGKLHSLSLLLFKIYI